MDDQRRFRRVYLVVMTTINTICSQTIRQKSPYVFGKGPKRPQTESSSLEPTLAKLNFITNF